jgi:hypothetical protein
MKNSSKHTDEKYVPSGGAQQENWTFPRWFV